MKPLAKRIEEKQKKYFVDKNERELRENNLELEKLFAECELALENESMDFEKSIILLSRSFSDDILNQFRVQHNIMLKLVTSTIKGCEYRFTAL